MPRKTVTLSLFISMLFYSSIPAPRSFAADVETNGNLKVNGMIESASGGFKFPDGSTLTTVGVTGTPVAHGVVGAAGNLSNLSHSSNVTTVSHTTTGVYEITVSGETMGFTNYTPVVSMADTGLGFINYAYANGHLVVHTYSIGGVLSDMPFSFIIMKE